MERITLRRNKPIDHILKCSCILHERQELHPVLRESCGKRRGSGTVVRVKSLKDLGEIAWLTPTSSYQIETAEANCKLQVAGSSTYQPTSASGARRIQLATPILLTLQHRLAAESK